jgi:hypothetical protein
MAACSNNPAPVPLAFIAATVGVGPESGSNVCNFGTVTTWLDVGVGTSGTTTPETQADGSSQAGAKIDVACTVATSGNGFDINLSVTENGTNGGSVTITSPSGMGAVTQSGGTGITGVFESSMNGRYRETDCTIAFTYLGQPVGQTPLAAGRIWGHLSCPSAALDGSTVMVDGGTESKQCDGEADFLFEQCGL